MAFLPVNAEIQYGSCQSKYLRNQISHFLPVSLSAVNFSFVGLGISGVLPKPLYTARPAESNRFFSHISAVFADVLGDGDKIAAAAMER